MKGLAHFFTATITATTSSLIPCNCKFLLVSLVDSLLMNDLNDVE